MDFQTKKIRHLVEGASIQTQICIESDYNVPDHKADVLSLIHGISYIHVEEKKRIENHMCIRGRLEFQILYETDGSEKKFQMLEGKIPFEERIYIGDKKDDFVLKIEKIDFTSSVIHSRKVAIHAVVDLELVAENDMEEEFAYDVEGEQNICLKKDEKMILQLHTHKQNRMQIKDEIGIQGTKENISEIIWKEVSVQGLEQKMEEGYILLRGNLLIFCMYLSEESQMDWIEKTQPFEMKISCDGVDSDSISNSTFSLNDYEITPRLDEDGEYRILGIAANLEADIQIYREQKECILEDLYVPECYMTFEYEEKMVDELISRNHAKCKINERFQIPEIKDDLLQICHTSGEMSIEHSYMEQEGLHVEGIMELTFFYLRSDENHPLGVWKGAVPFMTVLEVPRLEGEFVQKLQIWPDLIAIAMIGNDEIEVKASASIINFLVKRNEMKMISDASCEKLSDKEMGKIPSITGCMVCNGDTLWEIAKKYHTTIEQIVETNHLKEEQISPGDKLLIFKKTSCILNV